MRISDWSSDVCSSDLLPGHRHKQRARILAYEPSAAVEDVVDVGGVGDHAPVEVFQGSADVVEVRRGAGVAAIIERVGGAGDSTRGSVDHRASAQRADHGRELAEVPPRLTGNSTEERREGKEGHRRRK